jgi:diguanylate cyclase (GGDEF)-like protein/PAS domain S-box-containing protein
MIGSFLGPASAVDGRARVDGLYPEAWYHAALDTLTEGVIVWAADHRIIACNASAERLLGLSAAQLQAQSSLEMNGRIIQLDGAPLSPHDLPTQVALRTGQPQSNVVLGLYRPDETLIWISVNAQPLFQAGEAVPYAVVASFTDITRSRQNESERQRAEAAQRASDARLVHILDLASDAVISIDAGQRIQLCNAGAERIFGYSAAEMVGQPLELLLPERFRHSHTAFVEAFAASTETVRQMGAYREVWGRRKDGSEFPIEASIGRVEQNGQVVLNVILRDISERKQAEALMAERERRFRALTALAPVGIFETDLEQNCTFVNERWLELTGLSEAQLLGAGWLEAVHPADRARFLAEWQAAGDQEFALEYRLQTPASRVRWARCGMTVIRDPAGAVVGYLGAVSDITQTKQAELELSAANKRLSRSFALIEQRHQEIALLNTLSELLQSCHAADEAYEVIRAQAPLLFPDLSGALCLLAPSKNFAEVAVQWGPAPPENPVFAPDDCWALRRGRLHWLDASEGQGPACRHAGDPPPPAHLCAPMTAQGDALGILYLASQTPEAVFTDVVRQLAHTVADSLALSLANLRLRETLRHQSTRDPLTRLFNRRYMEETLERELRRASRLRSTVGLIMLDLDHFKHFNDTFGHAAGDTLLRELADFLRLHIRGEDVPCRYGGEEFCLILPGASLEIVQERARLLCEQAGNLKVFSGGQLLGAITLSLGVAVYPLHGATGEVVLQAADAALYRAKQQGRNRVMVA